MSVASVFLNNRTQAVRLPLELRLPEGTQRVRVRAVGNERVLSPMGTAWDSFFEHTPAVTEDFLPLRAAQDQAEREVF